MTMSDMMQLYYKEMEGNRDGGKPKTIIDTQTEGNNTHLLRSSAYTNYIEEFNNLLSVHIHSSQAEFEASLERLGLLPNKKEKTAEDITEEKAEQKDKSDDYSDDFIYKRYKISTAEEERNNETEITGSPSSFLERLQQ